MEGTIFFLRPSERPIRPEEKKEGLPSPRNFLVLPHDLPVDRAVGDWGIFAACIFVINRLHATALPYVLMKLIDHVWYTTLFGVPALLLYCLLAGPPPALSRHSWLQLLHGCYTVVCFLAVAGDCPVWVRHLTDSGTTARLTSNHTRQIDVTHRLGHRPAGHWRTDLTSRIPTNQVFELHVQQKTLQMPRLSPPLDGLTHHASVRPALHRTDHPAVLRAGRGRGQSSGLGHRRHLR